ncbi:hypothetical protein ACHAXT_007707 [Thalassiosira profunda]
MALQSVCDGASSETRASAGASRPLEEDGTKEEIDARNFERFGMLPEYSACFDTSKSKRKSRWGDKPDASNKSEGDADGACGDNGTLPESSKEEAFQLSEENMRGLPGGIQLPKTARQNTIIEHTASRIASNPQLEVFVKVKQGANADFSFLQPSDELHAYYLHLKEKRSNNRKDEDCSNKRECGDSDGEPDNPLSGLLGGYGSSSDESSSPVKNGMATIGAEGEGACTETQTSRIDQNAEAASQASEVDKKRKADRMERLRAWKESKLKQS